MNSFSSRLAAARTRAAGNLSFAFRNQSGAFDLPSVLIGVAVVAILAIGVMATIFGIVPYAQNKAAQQNVAAIVTAQGTYYAQYADTTSQYASLAGLQGKDLLGKEIKTDKLAVAGDQDQWAIATISASGQAYIATNENPTPTEWGTSKKSGTAPVGRAEPTGRVDLANALAEAVARANTGTTAKPLTTGANSVDGVLTITSNGRNP